MTHALRIPLLALLAAPWPLAAQPAAAADPAIAAFAEALRSCTPARHGTPHPFVRGFTSEHEVIGPAAERCAYTQSMPGGMRMDCAFDEPARAAMADELVAFAAGRLSGGSGTQPAWAGDCEIVGADGKRTPFGA